MSSDSLGFIRTRTVQEQYCFTLWCGHLLPSNQKVLSALPSLQEICVQTSALGSGSSASWLLLCPIASRAQPQLCTAAQLPPGAACRRNERFECTEVPHTQISALNPIHTVEAVKTCTQTRLLSMGSARQTCLLKAASSCVQPHTEHGAHGLGQPAACLSFVPCQSAAPNVYL